MGRMAMILGALSLVLGMLGCKGQAERDTDQTATGVRAVQAESGGPEIGNEDLGAWDGAPSGDETMGAENRNAGMTGGGPSVTTLLTVQIRAPYGEYLADSSGMSLYIFEADTPGEPSTCYDACAQAWPPLIAEDPADTGAELNLPAQLDPTLLGIAARRDGQMQRTYNGLPLYTYARDENPGAIEGQGVDGFGAKWYLIAPSGETIDIEGETSERSRDGDATILEDLDDVNELD